MLKIKLYELEKHRNETTFRPLLLHVNLFREIGVEFVKDGPCDFSFVGQASIIDKKSLWKNPWKMEYLFCQKLKSLILFLTVKIQLL